MKDMEPIEIYFKRLEHSDGLPMPAYQTSESAGMDIYSANREPIELLPGKRILVPTGFKMAMPKGYEAQIRPRSGLAYKHGITMLNSPGTIDSDYRGEVKVLAVNLGEQPYIINRGERIAQMIISRLLNISIREVDQLPETDRGSGGFGSTGLA